MSTTTRSLFQLSATEAVTLLRNGDVSPSEMVAASAERMEAVDGDLNALPTKCIDRAMQQAKAIEASGVSTSDNRRWLAGLPVAVKDLNPVAGVRTTYGSLIYKDYVPAKSDLLVERLEANGAIIIAKANTPEFAAGASTFNEVFGKTRNPWNTSKSVAGSSGGSAAALASGQVWLAHGSDLGGSLRTPASFNGIVGMRPSPGRVARGIHRWPYDTIASDLLFVEGPMARSVQDCALMLDAMVGSHPEDPLSLPLPSTLFVDQLDMKTEGTRVAFSPNLGIAHVQSEVASLCANAASKLDTLGMTVTEAAPDLSRSIDCFQVLRANLFAADHRRHLNEHRDKLKPDVVWNIEKGLDLTGLQIAQAEAERLGIMANMQAFFEDHDLLICPTAIVPPFDVDVRYVDEVDGHRYDNYVEWLAITFALSLTGLPIASIPVGITQSGLPVGMQVVGPPRGEAQVFSAAKAMEGLFGMAGEVPREPKVVA